MTGTGTALFVGWGHTHPGRESLAVKNFTEFIEKLTELKAMGEIDSFDPVLLSPHGGELKGFVLIHGTPEKLAALPMREDLHHLQLRAELDHGKFSVIWAVTGDRVSEEIETIGKLVSEYELQPALV
jgi:hypothetical protein